jgi:hypothetical protein
MTMEPKNHYEALIRQDQVHFQVRTLVKETANYYYYAPYAGRGELVKESKDTRWRVNVRAESEAEAVATLRKRIAARVANLREQLEQQERLLAVVQAWRGNPS